MMTLRETIYHIHDSGATIKEKVFGSKNEILKVLRKQSPLPGNVIYQLSKYNKADCEILGLKRKFEIVNEALEKREV